MSPYIKYPDCPGDKHRFGIPGGPPGPGFRIDQPRKRKEVNRLNNRKTVSPLTEDLLSEPFGLTEVAVGQNFGGSPAAKESGKSISINDDAAIISIASRLPRRETARFFAALGEADAARAADSLAACEPLSFQRVSDALERVFSHHPRVAAHSARVGELCRKTAAAMGLSDGEALKVGMAGLLHDIGKLYIDEALLDKPGTLDNPEWTIVRAHSEKGRDILAAVEGLSDLADCVYEHHEWFNGKGYPHGLQGESISLFARIIAVADAYDAMTSDRGYRRRFNNAEAVAELNKFAGTQFDPLVVRAIIEGVLATDNE